MSKKIELLKKLIENRDTLKTSFFDYSYTDKIDLSELGGYDIVWLDIANIEHVWLSVIDNGKKFDVKKPIIIIENSIIHFTPDIIQDYINKNSE